MIFVSTPACENGFITVSEPTLDDRFKELRQQVDREVARARSEVIAELSRAVSKMRAASNEAEWHDAVLDCGRLFASEPDALDLIASLATLTSRSTPVVSNQPTRNVIHSTTPSTKEAGSNGDASSGDVVDLAAQRFARVRIAEIRLYYASAVKAGRAGRDLYGSLKPHIEAARDAFRDRYLKNGTSTADYLHAEIVHALAHDDATLLGPDYPGPLA
jgi:hypothetical protein